MRARLFGNISKLSRIGQSVAPLTNLLGRFYLVKLFTEKTLGISRKRPLPQFATRKFSSWFKSQKKNSLNTHRGDIVYFNDTFTEYMHPEVGRAAIRILSSLGYNVIIEAQKECCGRPLISKGQLSKAKEWAKVNVESLLPYAERGTLIVGTEPSCLLTLKEEYPELLRTPESRSVASQALMLDELIMQIAKQEPDLINETLDFSRDQSIQVHGHCHQKAVIGTDSTLGALSLAGYKPELIDSACCGMAGTFGFEKEHYETSKAMGDLKLFPAIEAPDKSEWPIAISGISCRQQIGHFTSKTPKHWAEYIADSLKIIDP